MTDPCREKFEEEANYERFIDLRDRGGQHPGFWFKQDFLEEEKGQSTMFLIEEGLSSFLGIDTTRIYPNSLRINDDVTEYPPPQLISQISANAGISYPQNKQEEYLNLFVEVRSYMIDLLRYSFLWLYNDSVDAIMNANPKYNCNKQVVNDAWVMKIGRPDKEIPIDLDELEDIAWEEDITIQDIRNYVNSSNFRNDNGENWFDPIPGDPNGETSYDKLKTGIDRMAESSYIKNLDGVTLWNSLTAFWLLFHECCHLIYEIPPNTGLDHLKRNLYEIRIVQKVNVIRALHGKPERMPYSYGMIYDKGVAHFRQPLIILTQFDKHSQQQEYCGALTY